MITKTLVLFFSLLVSGIYPQDGNVVWFKGNMHTHSLWSDGDSFPEMSVDWYKKNGYHFIALSDHNTIMTEEKWVRVKEQDEVYQKYIELVDTSSVNFKREGENILVKLRGIDEYRSSFEEAGKFLIIQSLEISDKFNNKAVHVNASNIRELIRPQGGGSITEVLQNNINAVNQQREKTGIPMLPHINHPNFHWAITAEDIINIEGDKFFEIYNGHPLVNNYGDSLHPSIEEMWDIILSKRLRTGKSLMYGLAVDDAHNYLATGITNSNPGRGWVMVRASSLSTEALINALEKGDFYASTGVTLDSLNIDDKRIKISVRPEKGIKYKIIFTRVLKDTTAIGTKLFQEVIKDTIAEYRYNGTELYVRAIIESSRLKKNPYKEGEFEKAWIQPVIVK